MLCYSPGCLPWRAHRPTPQHLRPPAVAPLGALLVLCATLAVGCATGRAIDRLPSGQDAPAGALMTAGDHQRLEAIAQARGQRVDGGYRIGPDDLLDIRIPDLLESPAVPPRAPDRDAGLVGVLGQSPIFQQGVRVSAVGDITLPLLGIVRAAGMTPAELEGELARRLVVAGVLRRPQVSVMVAEYRSRVVAVVGSVERPGLYPLTRPGATVADLVWAAGGPNKDAGRLVDFVPAPESGATAAGTAPDLARLEHGEPIRIDLERLLHGTGTDALVLNPQVRPGDLISISPAGSVNVEGWVEKPGSYPITRSLTLTGAVAAAGGHLFPADCSRVTVKRALASGEQTTTMMDLDRIRSGEEPDLPITDGDVVSLPPSIPRMLPYGAWQLVTAIIHVGASVPLF
jgi:polysaccharide biosynthesis/export protein